jgi:hypothetical protein
MGKFKCGICQTEYDDALKNIHHRIPQAFGGTDAKDNLYFLCPSCHQSLHRMAEHYLDPNKAGLVRGMAQGYCKDFPNPQVSMAKILDLAKCAYEYELKVNQGLVKLNPWSEKLLSVAVPLHIKEMFEKACKRKVVFGKKGTMTSVIMDFIFKTILQQFPNESKNIQPYINQRFKK